VSAARPQIVVIMEDRTERVLDVGDVLTIGRSSKSDLVIDQLDCSRRHAELRSGANGCVELIDLGSRNGCYVNGVRIEGRRELHDGDRIDIAEGILRFVQNAPPQPEDVPRTPGVDLGVPLEESTAVLGGTGPELHAVSATPAPTAKDGLCAIVLRADIAGRARSEAARTAGLREPFVEEWMRDAARVIERGGGACHRDVADDPLVGQPPRATIGYWLVDQPANPSREILQAVRAVRQLVALAAEAAPLVAASAEGASFQPILGIDLGSLHLQPAQGEAASGWEISGEALDAAARLGQVAQQLEVTAVIGDALVRALPELRKCCAACPRPASTDRDGVPTSSGAVAAHVLDPLRAGDVLV